ncbi:hypothetical protein [Bradyrhizobium sp. Ash2021]|uniref:hypothetical protein n=1 Tax=Bradyrhizobium sp. Ash2021 TaxID=2954771 RepID=UPI002814C5E4|nr:hypothetical protein [Bradyrhizobium sp. Ash2021]WMT75427.1 hypothetical protein NL528_03115 [Bradyrhizobium sp. Ash2021]
MSFMARLERAKYELAKRDADPFRDKVEAAMRGKFAISTAAVLDLIGEPKTTGTARRLATVMRDLHFIPIKSRRLMPGGRAGNTITRGWARPIRENRSSPTIKPTGAAGHREGMIP